MTDLCRADDYARLSRGNSATATVDEAFSFMYGVAKGGLGDVSFADFDPFHSGWAATNLVPYTEVAVSGFTVSAPAPSAVAITYKGPSGVEIEGPTPNFTKVKFEDAPSDYFKKPTLYTPDTPDDLTATAPVNNVVLDTAKIPDDPNVSLPTVPTLFGITIPTAEELTIPDFEGVKPSINLVDVKDGIDYVEPPYVSAVKDANETMILDILDQGLIFPNAYWQSLVDRQNSEQTSATRRAVATATEEWALNGWDIASGPLLRKIREARESGEMEEGKTRREIFLKHADMEVDNIKFAVIQGLAWDTTNVQLFNAVQDRLLQVARARVEFDIALLNARVSIFNAQKDFWVAESQVHLQLIQAELLKLEKFKTEIEAQKLINEINALDVQIYKERIEGVKLEVEVFVAKISAVTAIYQNNRTKMQVYSEEVNAYEALVSAWGKEWDAYGSANQANAVKVDLYEAEWNTLKIRIDGYEAENRGKAIQLDSQVAKARADTENWLGYVRKYEADIRGGIAEVEALASQARSNSDYTRALTDLERVKVAAQEGYARIAVEQAKAKSTVDTANSQVAAAEIRSQQELAFKAVEARIRAVEQRIASALSGINASVGITDSVSWGFGTKVGFECRTNYNVDVDQV